MFFFEERIGIGAVSLGRPPTPRWVIRDFHPYESNTEEMLNARRFGQCGTQSSLNASRFKVCTWPQLWRPFSLIVL